MIAQTISCLRWTCFFTVTCNRCGDSNSQVWENCSAIIELAYIELVGLDFFRVSQPSSSLWHRAYFTLLYLGPWLRCRNNLPSPPTRSSRRMALDFYQPLSWYSRRCRIPRMQSSLTLHPKKLCSSDPWSRSLRSMKDPAWPAPSRPFIVSKKDFWTW